MELKKNKYLLTLWFWIACASVFVICNGYTTLFLRPQSVHVWRQADCVSYALNYYQNNQPFFEPQTQTLYGVNGHAASEFPVIYYVAGKLYHVFGPKEAIIRAINFLIFLFGCTCLLWLGFELYNNKWLALVPALITFTSPYLFYYALNFLPDVPALSLSLAGCFFLFRYFRTRALWMVYLAAFAFCLAMLLKVSAGIALFAMAGAIILSGGVKNAVNKEHRIHFILLFAFIVVINIGWIEFAKYYNRINQTGQNLLGLYPFWDAGVRENLSILHRMLKEWLWVILHPVAWIWVAVLFLFVIRKRKSLDYFKQISLLLIVLGVTLYSLFWFRAYQHHDYYMVNPFIAVIWMLLCACCIVDKANAGFQKAFAAVFTVILAVSVIQCRNVQWKRYHDPMYKSFSDAYFTVEPYLRSIGISRLDKVVSVPDVTPNVTLYFLNQPGWTEAFMGGYKNMDYFVRSGAKYLIIGDTSYRHKPEFSQHMDSLLGEYRGLYIYKVK